MIKKKTLLVRIVVIMLVFVLACPSPVLAATPDIATPAASYYLDAYTTYICPIGYGDLQIWWSVVGAGTQVDLGVLRIVVYESPDNETWTWKETFTHSDYSNMLSHNDDHHVDYVYFQGTRGYYYKAYVTIYGGNGTTGDRRFMWTPVEQAY